MKHILTTTTILLVVSSLHAQEKPAQTVAPLPDIAEDITALNGHFRDVAAFKIDRDDRLVTDYFDHGARYREDVAYLEFLNAGGVSFNPEENTVMVKCSEEKSLDGRSSGKCIDKEVMKNGAISQTGRMNLPVPAGDANGAKAIILLGNLLRDSQLVQRSEADATNPKRKRKN